MLRLPLIALLAAAVFAGGSAAARAQEGAEPPAAAPRQDRVLIPFPDSGVQMRTNVARPPGGGPFRLAIISHGTNEDYGERARHVLPRYQALVSHLVGRGYAVAVPQRPGHGETGGGYIETAGGCDDANFAHSGHATAKAIRVAIQWMMAQPYVRKGRVVLIGHSAGAWGSLALASRFPDLVESVINFAGGRGGHSYGVPNHNCAPERLVEVAGDFGRTTRVPTLWIYSSNDSYFNPVLARRMAEAYRAAGGSADLRIIPPVGDNGHFAVEIESARMLWLPLVDQFLRKHQGQTWARPRNAVAEGSAADVPAARGASAAGGR